MKIFGSNDVIPLNVFTSSKGFYHYILPVHLSVLMESCVLKEVPISKLKIPHGKLIRTGQIKHCDWAAPVAEWLRSLTSVL